MRPDPSDVLSVVLMLALLAAALPKRDWRSIPGRFRETARGERCYLFGPPDLVGPLSASYGDRLLQLLRAELRRAFELGIPVLLLAWYAEARSRERRQERGALWRESKAGLIFRALAGEMTEEDLHDRLRQRSYLLPAPRLVVEPPQRLTMPPMSEFFAARRWIESLGAEVQRTAELARAVPEPRAAPEPAVRPVAELEIQTLGTISICLNGEDFAPRLLHRPALAFTWLYLLAWEVSQPGVPILRPVLADVLFPRTVPQRQRRKLSQRLSETSALPELLTRRLVTEGEYVRFDLAGCALDVRGLLELAREVRAIDGPLSNELVAGAEDSVRLASGEFLPGWQEIERRGTDPGSGAERVIMEVREQVVGARLDLVDALARTHLAGSQPGRAVPLLEEAIKDRPEREHLARALADAYERTGQTQRAARLREEYGIGGSPGSATGMPKAST